MTEKNKGKKLLTWTLALSMTLALPPVGVFAEDGAGGEGSQQTNIASATEQPDGSSNGSGTANNEGNKLASTSEEGGQTNDPAPSLGTTGAPASSGEEKKGENETLTPLPTPVSGGEAEEGRDRHFCVRAIVLGIDLFVDTHYPSYHIFRAEELHKGLEFLENTAIDKAVQAIYSKENLLP